MHIYPSLYSSSLSLCVPLCVHAVCVSFNNYTHLSTPPLPFLTHPSVSLQGPEGTEGTAESYVVSSDEEEDARTLLNADLLSTLQASSQAR